MSIRHKLTRTTRRWVASDHVLSGLTLASFLESTIIPIPLEAVLIPLMQARRDILWQLALMATLGCMLGALFGYALGYYLFDLVGEWLITAFFSDEQFTQIKQQMETQGFWFVLTIGVAPIPFQVAMLAAGATQFSLILFLVATTIARSLRYFGLAWVVYIAGNRAESLIKRYRSRAVLALTTIVVMLWWLSNVLGR